MNGIFYTLLAIKVSLSGAQISYLSLYLLLLLLCSELQKLLVRARQQKDICFKLR